MTEHDDFERLERTAETIVGHRSYPGRQEAVRECLREIDEL